MMYRKLLAPLLLAYPREFRRHYREQVFIDVDDALGEHVAGAAAAGILMRTALDIVTAGLLMRLEIPVRDIAFALRSLVRAPLFSIVAILTLAMAIGVNGAVFAVINAVLLKPLPFVQPDRLAFVSTGSGISYTVPPPLLKEYRRGSSAFELATYGLVAPTLTGYGAARTLTGETISWNLFDVMRIHPQVGRFFTQGDARVGTHSVVISDRMWRTFFGRDPHAVGNVVRLDGTAWRIVGVTEPGFAMPDYRTKFAFGSAIDVLECTPASTFTATAAAGGLYGLVRLHQGVSLASARSQLRRIDLSFEARNPSEKGDGVLLFSLPNALVGDVRPLLLAAFGAVSLVLLIACANVANLLLVRATARTREFAVRTALGAQRSRLAAHVLTEAALLALAGGLLGALFAWADLNAVLALPIAAVPRIETARIELPVLLFLFGIVVFAAIVAGIVPILSMNLRNVSATLKTTGRGGDAAAGGRLRSMLVVAEIALAVVVLVASVLLARSAVSVAGVDLGFSPSNVYSANVFLKNSYADAAKQRAYVTEVLARVSALPIVASSSAALTVPGTYGAIGIQNYRIVGEAPHSGPAPSVTYDPVSPNYFDMLRIPLLRGRLFTAADRFGSRPVALVSRRFARQALGAVDPVGKLLLFPDLAGKLAFTIVGVVGDTRLTPQHAPTAMVYLPFDQHPEQVFQLLVRPRGAAAGLAPAVLATLANADPSQAVASFASLDSFIVGDTAPQRTNAWLLGILAVVALLLAVAGIYAVSAYSVAVRIHEFGVRMAIGARTGHVLRNVIGRSLRLALCGIALGLILAALTTRLLTNLLFGVSAFDPLTFIVVVTLLIASVTIASFIPAVRATRVDPVVALRYE